MLRSFLVWCICCAVVSVVKTTVNEDKLDCGPNEELECVGCPPEDTCYDRGQIGCAAVISGCSNACVCKEGFIRKTLYGECIPKEECGAPCKIFEQYTECKQCSNETCSSITNPVNCDGEEPQSCTPGCTCWDGYYRADENSYCQYRCSCPELEDTPYCVWWRGPLAELFPKRNTQH